MQTITIKKQALEDLNKVREELNSIMESLELMDNKDFLKSYKKSKQQIKKREFVNWNEL